MTNKKYKKLKYKYTISFKELNEDLRRNLRNYEEIKKFDESQKEKFIEDLTLQLEWGLKGILVTSKGLGVWEGIHFENFILGQFFEGLFKTILIKENFYKFFIKCENYTFQKLKEEFIKLLNTKKVLKRQKERISDVIDYVQIQRNNLAHFPLKSFTHYATYYEVYSVILKLITLFNLKISDEVVLELKETMKKSNLKYTRGKLRFEDVGL